MTSFLERIRARISYGLTLILVFCFLFVVGGIAGKLYEYHCWGCNLLDLLMPFPPGKEPDSNVYWSFLQRLHSGRFNREFFMITWDVLVGALGLPVIVFGTVIIGAFLAEFISMKRKNAKDAVANKELRLAGLA